jgi:carbon storage regulator
MLVLTRRLGETVVIDGGIQITVVAVQGNKVRLGISAPPSVQVDREEIHQRRAEFAPPLPDQPDQLGCPPGADNAREAT